MVMGSSKTFLDLPIEIRQQIWKSVLPGPRVIKIGLSIMHQRITDCAPPVLLHICRESRDLALRSYFQSFTTAHNSEGLFLNPMVDIVLLEKPCSHHHSYHCVDCRDFKLGPRLQRYHKADQVRVIAFNDIQLLESEDVILDLYKIFRGIEIVLVKVDCLVDEFRHAWKRRQNDLEQLFRLVKGMSSFDVDTNDVSIIVIRSWDDLLNWRKDQPSGCL